MLQSVKDRVWGKQLNKPNSLEDQDKKLPESCPFSFRRLNESLYLIRERDDYGEYPNIYVKVCRAPRVGSSNDQLSVIVLSDTGCATQSRNLDFIPPATASNPEIWNVRTVLEFYLNPGGKIPYLVMTTHCHFDHIMGIGLLPSTEHILDEDEFEMLPQTTVLSSAHDRNFIDPWSHLCKHSLTKEYHLRAPYYTIGIWARDYQSITYSHPFGPTSIPTGIMILHTPGHTPDSLSWYDSTSNLLCVGDSFYEATSRDTSLAPWGPEPRAAIIFVERSDLATWWKSLSKIINFVERKNNELSSSSSSSGTYTNVAISAAHVTTTSLNAETYLASIRHFMSRILRDEVPCKRLPDRPFSSKDLWRWDDKLNEDEDRREHRSTSCSAATDGHYDWVVQAPRRIVEEGRRQIPRGEWL